MISSDGVLRDFRLTSGSRRKKSNLPMVHMAGDGLVLFLLISWFVARISGAFVGVAPVAYIITAVSAFLALLKLYGCYRRNGSWSEQISCLSTAWLHFALIGAVFLIINDIDIIESLLLGAVCAVAGFIMSIAGRALIVLAAFHRKPSEVMARKFCLMGASDKCSNLHDLLRKDASLIEIYAGRYFPYMEKHGVFDFDSGDLDKLLLAIQDGAVEDILWVPHGFSKSEMVALDALSACRVRVYCVDDPDSPTSRKELYQHSHLVHSVAICWLWQSVKDTIDRTAALLAMVILSPLLIGVAIAIKTTSPGPVIFLQQRGGMNNRTFTIFKFRTMYEEASLDKTVPQAQKNDKRITPVGKFLRVSSIDELPQFANVLTGDMSFIGPRPHSIVHDKRYAELVPEYIKRTRVKPGLSGWAQVHGSRGYIDSVKTIRHRIELDNAYIDSWSFIKDIEVAIRTVLIVLKTTNAG